jgi:hypothetical protein
MDDRPSSVDLLLASWVLGRVTPEGAVEFATQALEDGCDDASIAIIAGSKSTTRGEIEDELPRWLRAVGKQLPSQDEALKTLVDDCAWRIANGEADPVRGAWSLWSFSANEDESPEFFDQVRLFVGLASECDNPGPHVANHCGEIVAEARRFLDRGGLRRRDTNS